MCVSNLCLRNIDLPLPRSKAASGLLLFKHTTTILVQHNGDIHVRYLVLVFVLYSESEDNSFQTDLHERLVHTSENHLFH